MFSSHSHLLLIHENIDIANKLRSLLPLQCALVTDRIHTVRFCFRKLGRIEEALEDYNDAIRCSPLLKWYHGASCWSPQLLTRAKVPTSSAAVIAESWNRDTFRGRISAAPATIARVASNILIILQEFLSEIDYNCAILSIRNVQDFASYWKGDTQRRVVTWHLLETITVRYRFYRKNIDREIRKSEQRLYWTKSQRI